MKANKITVGLGFASLLSLAMVSTHLDGAESGTDSSVKKLSLNDCFQLALKHNLDLQITRLDPKIAEYNLTGAKAAYDPTFNLGVGRTSMDHPYAVDPKKAGSDVQYDLRADTASAGITGKAPTGLSYELGGAISEERARADFNFLPALPAGIPLDGIRSTKQYFFSTGLTLRQPLLKNFWIDSDRLQIQVNRRNLKISELALLGKIMSTVSGVQQAYYDLLLSQEKVKILRAQRASAEQLLADARARVKAGGLPESNNLQFEQFVAIASEELIKEERNEGDLTVALRNMLTEGVKDWNGASVELTDTLNTTEEHFDLVGSWRDAMTKRPDIREFELDLEKHDIALRFDRNQLYPSLDLVGSYGLNAVETSLSQATTKIERGNHQTYAYGVVFSVPFSNQGAKSRYRANQEGKKQALLRFKQLEMSLMSEVENNGRQLRKAFERIEPSRRAAQLGEEIFKLEQDRMLLAPTASFILLQNRRRLTEYQVEAATTVVEYNKARAQLAHTRGINLEKNSIEISFK